LQHFLPELDKVFNEGVMRPIDLDILYGLGLVELQGFGTRQEAIMNPKILFEELDDAVGDLTEFYSEIIAQIIERNKSKIKTNDNIRVVPGVIKATLTDEIKKLVKDYANTGQLSLEDSFEVLPTGFDFEVNKTRRIKERDNGDEDLFFPRVILNQDSNESAVVPVRPNATPQEIPQDKKTAELEISNKPYGTIDDLPDNIKSSLPIPAQITWLKACNIAICKKLDNDSAKEFAWNAVERNYQTDAEGTWVKKPNTEKLDAQLDELSKLTTIEINKKKSKLLDNLLKDK